MILDIYQTGVPLFIMIYMVKENRKTTITNDVDIDELKQFKIIPKQFNAEEYQKIKFRFGEYEY